MLDASHKLTTVQLPAPTEGAKATPESQQLVPIEVQDARL